MNNIYNESYFNRPGYNYKKVFKAGILADMIQKSCNPLTVLDLGSATALLGKKLIERGITTYNADYSEWCVANAETSIFKYDITTDPPDIQYVEKNSCKYPDVVSCCDCIEHIIEEKLSIVFDLFKKLQWKNLFLLISDSNSEKTHVSLHSRDEWIKIFEANGFVFDKSRTMAAINTYLSSPHRGEEGWDRTVIIIGRQQ